MSIYKLAFKNFKRRKLRNALTMVGIIGVIAITTISGLGVGLTSFVEEEATHMHDKIVITNSSAETLGALDDKYLYLDKDVVSKIRSMPQLSDIQEETYFIAYLNSIPLTVEGISNWNLIKDDINGTPGVVINTVLIDQFNYKIRDNITIKNKKFTITGTIENSDKYGNIMLDADQALSLNKNRV